MSSTSLSRRQFLRAGAAGGAALLAAPGRAPAFVRSRPQLTHGIQSGDVTADSATVWARADRPSRMIVDVAPTPGFRHARRLRGPLLTPDHDFAGKVLVDGLESGRPVAYRVTLEDLYRPGLRPEPLTGSFTTAPRFRRDVSFTWSGDLAGQGWGHQPRHRGLPQLQDHAGAGARLLPVQRRHHLRRRPADPDGRAARRTDVAQRRHAGEVEGVRDAGRLPRGLRVQPPRRQPARVRGERAADQPVGRPRDPQQLVPGPDPRRRSLHGASRRRPRGTGAPGVLRVAADRAAPARRVRSHLPPHLPRAAARPVHPGHADLQGPQRDRRLRRPERRHPRSGPAGMARARAGRLEGDVEGDRQDLPLGLVVPDTPGTFEGVSQGDNGAPLGRELEFAEILRSAHQRGIGGIVFLTADVHYTSAHHYDPARAAIGDFTPFWEFVSGPLNAGAFGPNALDTTFGPQTVFSAAPAVANTSPADGFQFFGYVTIDGHTEVMTVSLRDLDGKELFSVDLTP